MNNKTKQASEQPAQGCDYCNHPQYAGTKCKNCGSEPAQQRHISYVCPQCYWSLEKQPAQQQEPVAAAMRKVIEALQQDPEYAWGWHCNIAMAFVDAGGDHYTGNQGAARFMKMLANVEPAHELPSPPASKPWVGLTDEEFKKIKASLSRQEGWDGDGWDLALKEAIEAKLKERNT